LQCCRWEGVRYEEEGLDWVLEAAAPITPKSRELFVALFLPATFSTVKSSDQCFPSEWCVHQDYVLCIYFATCHTADFIC
jgi:hypothetical protein